MDEQGLPGLQARYEFVPAGEEVELRVRLTFDPAGTPRLDNWAAFRDRLTGASGDNRILPGVAMVTSLAAAAMTATADGAGLRERLADFAAEVAAGPAPEAAPIAADLAFSLTRAGVADLPDDIFELGVRLDVGGAPIAIASPRLEGGLSAFATAFEQAWQGFDGADGRLVLAVESSGDPALWCVRTGPGHGLAIARTVTAGVQAYAVPPLSTWPLAGTIQGADGGAIRVEAIDLDLWWDLFAAEFGRLAAAADSGDLQNRFERARGALARAMAGRLLAMSGSAAGDGLEEARAVFKAAANADLRSRPVVAAAAVEIRRGSRLLGEPASVLHGRVSSPVGASGSAPGAVRLKAGRQWLAYAAPAAVDDRVHPLFSIRFEGDRIDRRDAPPLSLILPSDALALDLGPQSVPVPSIGVPGPPLVTITAGAASPGAPSLSAALAWTVEIDVPVAAAQDRLELAIAVEEATAPVRSPGAAPADGLFGALGRAVHLGGALPAGPGPDSLALFAASAEAVAEALPGWRAPVQEAPPLPGAWHYAIDFGDLPALIVTRETRGPGPSPPWPEVAGYRVSESEEATARYEPEAPVGAGLRIAVPGLRLLADRNVRVHGRVRRNGGLAEAVDPAFVYWGASASSQAVSPLLEWQAPEPEPPSASLAAALGVLLAAIDEGSKRPYALGLEAGLVRRLEAAGEEPFETRIPLALVPPVTIGGAQGVAVAEFKAQLARALSEARTRLGDDGLDDEVALAITLFDEAPVRGPLARLTVRIPVPGEDSWWGSNPA